jgi:hypothetical protein
VSGPFAQLIEDGGASAGGGVGSHPAEFFRGAHFLEAEGATHTLRIETDEAELLAPLIVRPIGDGPDRDAVSPYGYPGFAVIGNELATLDPADVDFSRTGLVSAFIRHRLDLVPLRGSSERNVVQIADPASKPKSRPADRRQIRRNLEAGYSVELTPGSETTAAQRADFLDLYEQTMRRTDASSHYFFGATYFDRLRQRRLPPLLPQRQRRHSPRRLADEERSRPPGRAVDGAPAAAQPRRRPAPRRRAGGVQARLRQPDPCLAHLGADLRAGALRGAQRGSRRRRVLPCLPRHRLNRGRP